MEKVNDNELLSNIIVNLISNRNYLLAKEYCQKIVNDDGIIYLIDVLNTYINNTDSLFKWMIFMDANYDMFINYIFIFPDSGVIVELIIDVMRDKIASNIHSDKDLNIINKFILSIPHKFLSNEVCKDIIGINNNYFSYLNANINVTNDLIAWYYVGILHADNNRFDNIIADIHNCKEYKDRSGEIISLICNYFCDMEYEPKLIEKLFCNSK